MSDVTRTETKKEPFDVKVDNFGHLGGSIVGVVLGLLPLSLLFARRSSVVGDVMIGDPVSLVDVAPLEEVRQRFEEYSFLGLPVVDGSGLLVGVVQRSDVEHAAVEEAEAIDGAAARELASWLDDARARAQADRLVAEMRAALLSDLAQTHAPGRASTNAPSTDDGEGQAQ